MKIKRGRIADYDEVGTIVPEIVLYFFNHTLKVKDFCKGFVGHRSMADGGFEQFDACFGHLWTTDANQLDVISPGKNVGQGSTMSVGAWLGSAEENSMFLHVCGHDNWWFLEHFKLLCLYLCCHEDKAGKEDCTAILKYREQI
jgi:hypothetical protein